MTRFGTGLARTAAVFALALAVACTPLERNHGYVPSEEDLAEIVVGVDTRETVAQSIGRPSAGGVLSDGGFYYVRSRVQTVAWRAPQEVDRQVVAISFDDSGAVANVERFTLEDGQVVALSRRVTESNIRNVSLIRQLLGNLGRFRADQFID